MTRPGAPGSSPTVLPTVPSQHCFEGSGAEYRGVAGTAASGLSCLAWNSDLLYQELHVDSVGAAALLGLGPHAYCRSALACPTPHHLMRRGWGLSWGRGQAHGAQGHNVHPQAERCWGGGIGGPTLPGPPTPLTARPPASPRARNPDKDQRPWCYVVKDSALSWEYCRLDACGARGWRPPWASLLPSRAWPPLFGGPLPRLADGDTEAHWSRARPRSCGQGSEQVLWGGSHSASTGPPTAPRDREVPSRGA